MLKLLEKAISNIVCIVFVCIGFCLFLANTDIGRHCVCRMVSHISSIYYDANVVVSGWDGGASLSRVCVKSRNYSLAINNISLSYLNDFSILVDSVSINNFQNNDRIVDFSGDIQLPAILGCISSVQINNVAVNDICVEHFRYNRRDDILRLCGSIKNGQLECVYDCNKRQCDFFIDGCMGVKGYVRAFCRADGNLSFQSSVKYTQYLIDISGECINSTDTINLNARISGEAINGKLCGVYSIKDKKFSCNGTLNNMPKLVGAVFRNDNISVGFSGNFDLDGNADFDTKVYNDDMLATTGTITCKKGDCKIKFNVEKIDLYSLKISEIESKFNLNNIYDQCITVLGENWSIYTNILFNETCTTIRECSINHDACCSSISEPFVISENNVVQSGLMSIKIDDIRCISDFFYGIVKKDLSGSCIVTINSKNNSTRIKVGTDKLSYKMVDCYSFEMLHNGHVCDLYMAGCEFFGQMLSDLHISKIGEKIDCSCVLCNDGYLKTHGKFENMKLVLYNFDFLLDEFKISSKDVKVDFLNGNFESACDINCAGGSSKLTLVKSDNILNVNTKMNNVPLRIIQKIDKRVDSTLVSGLTLKCDAALCIKDRDILGNIKVCVNDNVSDVLYADVMLDRKLITLNSKYSRFGDYIDCRIVLPAHIMRNSEVEIAGNLLMSVKLKNLFFIPFDGVLLNGDCNAELSFSGTSTKPMINGKLKIDNGGVETSAVSVKNITIDTVIRNNSIDIIKANAVHRNGRLDIKGKGTCNVQGVIPKIFCNMDLYFSNFDLINSDSLKCIFNGSICANGAIEHLTLSGNIDMSDGVYDIKNIKTTGYSDINIIRIGKRPKTINKTISHNINPPFNFDIKANCRKLQILGDSISAIFNGNLNVISFNDMLALDGNIKLKDGHIKMVGSRIKLRSGDIIFRKEDGLNPRINLSGNSIVRDMQVFVDIHNNQGKLNVDIHSNPSYSIEDILSKIIFNIPFQELSLAESTKLSNAVKNMNHTENSLSALDFIKDFMFIDSVSFSESSNGKEDVSTMNAGKYIGDKIYFGVEKASEKEAKYKVRLNVSPQVAVEANSRGEAGISWMYRY